MFAKKLVSAVFSHPLILLSAANCDDPLVTPDHSLVYGLCCKFEYLSFLITARRIINQLCTTPGTFFNSQIIMRTVVTSCKRG